MLDAYIIQKIREREEQKKNDEAQRPFLYIEDEEFPLTKKEEQKKEPVVIQL